MRARKKATVALFCCILLSLLVKYEVRQFSTDQINAAKFSLLRNNVVNYRVFWVFFSVGTAEEELLDVFTWNNLIHVLHTDTNGNHVCLR